MAGDVKVTVVTKLLNLTVGSDTDFTEAGFGTPKACRVFVTGDATDDASVQAQSRQSIGFSDFTNHRCITHQDEDASAKVDCDALKSATKCYSILDAGASEIVSGTASTIADGVRLTHTTGQGSALRATVVMYGGADLSVSLNSIVTPNSIGGTTEVTGSLVSGEEALVFFIGTDIAAEDSSSTGINNSFGVCHIDAAHTAFANRCIGWASDHNANDAAASSIIHNNQCLGVILEDGSEDWGQEVTSASATSYTITERVAASGANLGVAVNGVFIVPCTGSVFAGRLIRAVADEDAVANLGSQVIPASAEDSSMAGNIAGRAYTAGASGGFAVIHFK